MVKKFYRVGSESNLQGLWYNPEGEFTGLIHSKYDFCKNSTLEMPFDPEIAGWLSAVDNLEDLYTWFSKEDLERLADRGIFIHEYEATSWKWYEKFQHWVICQKTSKLVK